VAKTNQKPPFSKQRVTYTNGRFKLVGIVYKPNSPGPFPTIIWNAGISYAKELPFVDSSRIVAAGCSFGGIQTLLAAERDGSFKAAFPISPAALPWEPNPEIQNRLIAAVRNITIPTLLVQPPKDASLKPSRVLGEEARKLVKTSFTAKIYPATMRRLE
jgi:dienelactone hydrolase